MTKEFQMHSQQVEDPIECGIKFASSFCENKLANATEKARNANKSARAETFGSSNTVTNASEPSASRAIDSVEKNPTIKVSSNLKLINPLIL